MASVQGLCFHTQHHFSTKIYIFRQKETCFESSTIRCENVGPVEFEGDKKRKPQILIAGGGVGGLVLALAAKNQGFGVKVFEKNLSAVRGEGRHRGPIQLQSNALAVLEAIDKEAMEKIFKAGCVTGNRINGLADGITGHWFAKFDLLTPAVKRGLPVTLVISRMALQDILVDAVGLDIVYNRSNVVDFEEDSNKVTVILEDGRRYEGDILVGADGIWSKVRAKLFGWQDARYSNYTCYSGLVDFVPPYISSIGLKRRLLKLFGSWCSEVVTLISETPEHMILRRDVYDRDMMYTWGRGHVTLLGDAAHPMQPNLGQGGCMAIEDCYQLVLELEKAVDCSSYGLMSDEVASALKRYEEKRMIRVRTVHAVARMASKMFLTAMRIPHPGLLGARFFLEFGMPWLMAWMLAGHGLQLKKKQTT